MIRLRHAVERATAQLGEWGLTPELRRYALWGVPLRGDLVHQAQLGILGTAAWCRQQIEAELKEKASSRPDRRRRASFTPSRGAQK
jgi:hypothetical protein